MTVQALVLTDNPAVRDWLSTALAGRAVVLPADHTDPEGFAAEVSGTPGVGLVFVEFCPSNAAERAAVLARVSEEHPSLTTAAVGQQDNSDAVLAAMRSGARDFLVVGRDDHNLGALLTKGAEPGGASRASSAVGAGQLYSVVSAASGVGISFLATHLALALQYQGGDQRRVLLLDLTVPGGASLIFLNTEQGYNALDAIRDVDRSDQTLIETAFTRYQNGIFLLSLPEDAIAPAPLDAQDFGRLLDNLAKYFDHLVVAANPGIGLAPLAALLARSNRSLLTTDQTVLAGRQNKHLLHALRQMDTPMAQVGLVIDGYDAQLDLTGARLAELLELPHVANLGGQERVHLEAMNAGESLFEYAERDPYCKDIDALVGALTGEKTAPPTKARGWLGRWLG